MCFRVEYPVVEGNHAIVRVKEVKVLECLCNEEALLNVIFGTVCVVDIFESCVASTFNTTLLLQSLVYRVRWNREQLNICTLTAF